MELSNKILSDLTVHMKYAKYIPHLNRREVYEEIVTRNKNMHLSRFPELVDEIEVAYRYVYDRKILPSMRSMQFAGKPIEVNPVRLYNCSFLPMDHPYAFSEVMFLLLSGVGVGYSVQKHHVEKLPEIRKPVKLKRYLVADSIEGWADAVKMLIKSYYNGTSLPIFDFSDIRPKGARLVTSGGKAPGPEPLKDCLHNIEKIFNRKDDGDKLLPIEVHDICCFIADAVLSGGIRRSAMISLFDLDDEEMLNAKHFESLELNPHRHRSNNSAVIVRHKINKNVFYDLWKRIELSRCGEPGIFFTNDKDWGLNPCAEISLRPFQFCNLVTINASDIIDQQDFNNRARAAAFIGTLQASYTNFHYLRDVWKKTTEKEALIGVSMTGIASGTTLRLDLKEAANIVKDENERVAKKIGINKAARTTTVKPEGCQTADTLISSPEGIFELGELGNINGNTWQYPTNIYSILSIMGNTSASLYGRYNPVGKFFNNGIADTKKIHLTSGLCLEATYNHQYKILKNNEYVWCRADELEEGDIVPYTIGTHAGGTLQTLEFIPNISKYSHNHKTFPTTHVLDEEFAWVLGLYYADGSNHTKGIRISGNWKERKGFDRLINFFSSRFGVVPFISKHNSNPLDLRCQLIINSVLFLQFLEQTGLIKEKSFEINVPLLIRKSPVNIIKSFFDGFILGDGNISREKTPTFTTTSEKFATQSVVILRLIGLDAKMRKITSRVGGYGSRAQYCVSLRQGRANTDISKLSNKTKLIWEQLDNLNLSHMSYDIITNIENSRNYTVDIEVPANETYVANSYVSHNTTSLVLGSSSGIHAWHNDYYIRTLRVGKNESIYKYLLDNYPELLQDEIFKPKTQAIISVPQKAPDDAITRRESALDLLSRVTLVWHNWVLEGHRKGNNVNNVSTTVSIKPDEWDEVGNWMWKHRDEFTALSVLPYEDHIYAQAPFQDITKDEYEILVNSLHSIDLSNVTEMEDETAIQETVACGGNACEVR